LLDGFSLELLDGDAGMLEQSWINAVFGALNVLLTNNDKGKNSSRIFVLSVMGVQSSGKSTLLNLMFGTRLRASAGMCTRGVNIQLLKAEDRSEYDYILILDTEGVRAPEFSGLEGSTWRDNRLATFSILPADVTIIMINNEEDTAAREVLPIVMLAYQQSELAAKSTNQLKTKLFFVYTRIDTNEKSKLSGIAQSLSLELRKAAADLEHNQRHSANDSNNCDQNLASELLHDFLITDIQFLGKLKVRDKPPEDVPEFDYGHDIVKLNAYIYDRLTKSSPRWQARELCKFAEYMSAIWQCVQTVDFTLSFKTVLERWAYEDLQAYCRDMYGKLASLFSSAYDKLEPTILTTLNDSSLTSNDCEKIIDKFQSMFSASVQAEEGELTGDFVSHINQQKVTFTERIIVT
jgi:GTPase Era involved in 16S rRNA processing